MNATGRERMLDHLRQQGEAQIQDLWERAREQIRLEKEDLEKELLAEQHEAALQQARQAEQFLQTTLFEAKRKNSAMRSIARHAFAKRLWARAVALLPSLLKSGGGTLLEKLFQELPPLSWTRVRVHSRDHEQAQKKFPLARIQDDDTLAGGFVIEAEGGKIKIVNTLSTRLEKIWQDQLPEIMADFSKEKQ